jgi:hypothetical protein
MSIHGQINLINNTTIFFAPIVLGGGKPTGGFVPSKGNPFGVTVVGLAELLPPPFPPIPVPLSTTASSNDGTFSLPDFPSQLQVKQAAVFLELGGHQHYRSQFFPYPHAQQEKLSIYLYQPELPASDGISAGQISSVLGNEGLPGNTQLTSTPWGISLAGSESQASIQFGIQIVPDNSANLSAFLDLSLNGWNIHVGWPESWCESADDILSKIKSGLGTAGSAANTAVQQHLTAILEGPPLKLNATETQNLLKNVSIQFATVSFQASHSWPLSNKTDGTRVIFAQPVIGYPRGW